MKFSEYTGSGFEIMPLNVGAGRGSLRLFTKHSILRHVMGTLLVWSGDSSYCQLDGLKEVMKCQVTWREGLLMRLCSGVERLRQQDTRSILRVWFNSSASDRWQQAASGDSRRRPMDRPVQAPLSVELRLGNTWSPALRPRLHCR